MDNYRDAVMAFKEAIATKNEFYVFDTETTGLNASDNDVIEFGALKVRYDGGAFKVVDCCDIYINIGYPLPDIITEITGITDLELSQKGISTTDAAYEIKKFLGDSPILVGYNSVTFDTPFMQKMFQTQLSEPFTQTVQLDVLTMAKEKTPKPHKLINMAEKAGLTGIEFHRAIDDCKATLGVLLYLLPMYDEKEPETDVNDITIMGIRRWTKSHTLDRLYVSNSKNLPMYYDIYTKNWYVGENCDLETVITKVLDFAGVSNDAELVAMY